MREPRIARLVKRHLRLLAAIRIHAPYLHQSAAYAVEPDMLAIRRILRTVIQIIGGSQSLLLPCSVSIHHIDVADLVVVTHRTVSYRLAVRAPPMQVARA